MTRLAPRLLCAAALSFFLCAPSGALEVTQSAAGVSSGNCDFLLSGALLLSGVRLRPGGPVLDCGGRVRILEKSLFDKLLSCAPGKPAAGAPTPRLLSVRLADSGPVLAQAELSFDGELAAVFAVERASRDGLDRYEAVPPSCLRIRDARLAGRVRALAVDAAKRELSRRAGGEGK